MSNLKTTEVYSLDIVDIKDSSGELSPGYRITNLKTGVREFETFMLGEAVMFLDQMGPSAEEFLAEVELDTQLHS
jgi:hypothetical protein